MTTSAQTKAYSAICRLKRLGWPVLFVTLVLAGLLIAGTGYQHGLPYIDFGDEMTIWAMGRAYFDPSWTMFQPEYPPGLLVVSATIQRAQIALGDPYPNPAATTAVMRLTSVLATTATLALTMLLANRMAGPWAAGVAGLCWMSLPLVNFQAKVATIDAWMCAWFTAAMVTGVEGWYRRSARWIGLSLLLAIIATLFKWQAAAALCLPGLVLLTFWRTNRHKMIALMAGYLIVVGAFSYWVIFVHRALEGGVYMPGTKTAVPTLQTVLTNLATQLGGVGSAFAFGALPLLALVLSLAIRKTRHRLHFQMGLWSFPVVIVALNVILSFNGAPVFTRQYLATMTLLAVMAGIGVVLLARLQLPPLVRAVPVLIIAAILIWSWGSQFLTIFDMNWEDSLPDRRVMFADWARTTATDGPLLISDPMLAAAVQTLYGYRGRPIETPYNQGISVYPPEDKITPELVAAKNIRYLILSPQFDVSQLHLPVIRLASTLDMSDSQARRGPDWAAYYVDTGDVSHLADPAAPLALFGGEIALDGYMLSEQSACPGDSITTRLVWNAPKTPTRYYAFFMHLSGDKTGELSFPINGQQPVSDDRPTITWNNPGERLLGPAFAWTLPNDLPPGTYRLFLGLFEPVSGNHLLLPDGKHYHVLATLEVGDCTIL